MRTLGFQYILYKIGEIQYLSPRYYIWHQKYVQSWSTHSKPCTLHQLNVWRTRSWPTGLIFTHIQELIVGARYLSRQLPTVKPGHSMDLRDFLQEFVHLRYSIRWEPGDQDTWGVWSPEFGGWGREQGGLTFQSGQGHGGDALGTDRWAAWLLIPLFHIWCYLCNYVPLLSSRHANKSQLGTLQRCSLMSTIRHCPQGQ